MRSQMEMEMTQRTARSLMLAAWAAAATRTVMRVLMWLPPIQAPSQRPSAAPAGGVPR